MKIEPEEDNLMVNYDSLDALVDMELDDSLLLLDDVSTKKVQKEIDAMLKNLQPKKSVKANTENVRIKAEPETNKSTEKFQSSSDNKKLVLKFEGGDESLKKIKMLSKTSKSSYLLSDSEDSADGTRGKNKDDKVPYVPWSETEDQKLKNIVERKISELATEENPEPDNSNSFPWGAIATRMTGRTPKQCRERWRNKLNPAIRQEPWTVAEDITLMDMHSRIGNRWVLLASLLPGRSENSVKTRFKSIIRAKRRCWRPEEDSNLLKYYNMYGGKWIEIAEKLPNRTANGVKVRLRHLMSGNVEKQVELGDPSQSFGIEMPEVLRKNEKFLIEYTRRQEDNGKKSLKRTLESDSPSVTEISTKVESPSPHEDDNVADEKRIQMETIHPTSEKAANVNPTKRAKGTRALIMDELQKDEKDSEDYGSFATTIASILNPWDVERSLDHPMFTSKLEPLDHYRNSRFMVAAKLS